MANGLILLALSNPVDGKDDAFNRWYDNQHPDDDALNIAALLHSRGGDCRLSP